MLRSCQDAIRKVRGDFAAEPREFHGEHEHLHLHLQYPPRAAVPALGNSLKGLSARRVRSEATGRMNRHIRHGHFWSPFSLAASYAGAPPRIIR